MIILSRESLYDERTDHTNYYNKYGKIVPSVTTVLKVISKEALVQWANNLGWKRMSVKRVLDDSSIIGTYVHNYAEAIMMKDKQTALDIYNEVIYMENDVKDYIINGMNSFILWWRDNEYLTILNCEREISCDLYGGTIDIEAKNDKNKIIIIDMKTSKSIYCTMYLQLSAYAKMYEINTGITPSDVAILLIDKYNGKKAKLYYLSDLDKGHISLYYETFRRALSLYECVNLIDKKWN